MIRYVAIIDNRPIVQICVEEDFLNRVESIVGMHYKRNFILARGLIEYTDNLLESTNRVIVKEHQLEPICMSEREAFKYKHEVGIR